MPNGRVDVAEAAVRVRLGDVIGIDTTCVRSDVKIEAVTELLVDSGLRAVPVVDEGRRLVGIVSKSDLLRPRGTGKARTKVVSDIMTPVVHGLPEDAPVAYAISLMAFEGLHEVPVVDARSHVIGMVTSTDALRWVAQSLGYVVPGVVTVPEEMTPSVGEVRALRELVLEDLVDGALDLAAEPPHEVLLVVPDVVPDIVDRDGLADHEAQRAEVRHRDEVRRPR